MSPSPNLISVTAGAQTGYDEFRRWVITDVVPLKFTPN